MDIDNLDSFFVTPEQRALKRYLSFFGVLLLITFLLPIDRIDGSPVNVWDRFGIAGGLEIIQLLAPAAAGLLFVCINWMMRLSHKLASGITATSLIVVVLVGVNPLELFRVVSPPIAGNLIPENLQAADGSFFPREDAVHLTLLGLGLVLLGVGGRYRALLNSSRLSTYVTAAGTVILMAYYTVPYNGQIAAARNVALYQAYYTFAQEQVERAHEVEAALSELDVVDAKTKKSAKRAIKATKQLGMLKMTSIYYMVIYFLPLMLALLALPSWPPSQFKGHRTTFAQAAGWGSSIYLLAFLLPLAVKDSVRDAGVGFGANFRSYIILAAVFLGLSVALSTFLKNTLEADKNDDHLERDPLAWSDSEV